MKQVSIFAALLVLAAALICAISIDYAAANAVFAMFSDPSSVMIAPVAAAVLPESIKSELERIAHDVHADVNGLRAALQSTQQHVAAMESEGGYRGRDAFGGPSIGSRAVENLNNDASFKAAEDAARRGQKPSHFAARVNVDGSIKAALVNEGMGDSNDTTVPSQPDRRGVFGPVLRPLRLLDVLPTRPTSSDSVEYVKLTATGEAAEQEQEGDPKAELSFSGTPDTANIVTVAGWTTASKQVLSDHSALQQQIDRVIRHKVLSRLENRLINGVGGQGKIDGLLNQAFTLVPTIGESAADVIGESLVRQANSGYLPNLVLLNPLDWYRLQITRNNAADNEYLFGSPTMPVPPVLWNTRIVTTPSMPEGTGMTLDTSFTTVLDREQMTISVSNAHEDYFVRNLVAILGELRAGLEVLDTGAVCKFDVDFEPALSV